MKTKKKGKKTKWCHYKTAARRLRLNIFFRNDFNEKKQLMRKKEEKITKLISKNDSEGRRARERERERERERKRETEKNRERIR